MTLAILTTTGISLGLTHKHQLSEQDMVGIFDQLQGQVEYETALTVAYEEHFGYVPLNLDKQSILELLLEVQRRSPYRTEGQGIESFIDESDPEESAIKEQLFKLMFDYFGLPPELLDLLITDGIDYPQLKALIQVSTTAIRLQTQLEALRELK